MDLQNRPLSLKDGGFVFSLEQVWQEASGAGGLVLYYHSTAFTAITGDVTVFSSYFFKIVMFYFPGFQTFRAAVSSKFLFSDGEVTMPAAEFTALCFQQCKYIVFARFHENRLPFTGFCLRGKYPVF